MPAGGAGLRRARMGGVPGAARNQEVVSLGEVEFGSGQKWGKTRDAALIKRYWTLWPEANIGITTGADNGFFVVEADTAEGHSVDGIASLHALEAQHGKLPDTLTAESPSGSLHYYFKYPGLGIKIKNSASEIAPGVDVRGDGGMVLAPPSVKHGSSRGAYTFISNADLAEAPDWLIERVKEKAREPREWTQDDDEPDADPGMIAFMLAVTPSDSYQVWFENGAAIRRVLGSEGFERFNAWSAKSKKYSRRECIKKWEELAEVSGYSIGTIYHHADEADPGWRERYDEAVMEKLNAAAEPEAVERMLDELRSASGQKVENDADDGDIGDDGNGIVVLGGLEDAASEQPRADQTKTEKEPPKDDQPRPEAEQQRAYAEPSTAPVDLWNKFETPQLPTGLLPAAIEKYAFEKGKLMGADPAGLAMAALTVCAAAVPDHVKLKVKRHDSWMESTRQWTGLVGDPSSKKSPIIYQTKKPLARIDTDMWRTYSTAKARWDALSRDEKRTTPAPRQTRIMVEDTTIEALQEILRDSPDGVLCVRDELSGWFGSMDKYAGHRGAAADRGFWLQAYNGGSYAYNRISRGAGLIENMSASLLGGIQPEPMREIADGTVDDGLIQRIIPVMLAPATMGTDAPTSDAEACYGKLVEHLHKIEKPFDDLMLDDGAMQIREQLEQKHLDLMACRAFNRKLAAHIGKYDGIFARLCLLWHCIESSGRELEGVVSVSTAQRVANFLHDFLLPHALAFYTSVFGLSDDNERLMDVAGYILAHKVETVTNRVIQRSTKILRRLKARDVEDVLHQLDALGWVNRVQVARMRWPRWNVNPEVHRLFRERAEQEAARRQRDREMIIALTTRRH